MAVGGAHVARECASTSGPGGEPRTRYSISAAALRDRRPPPVPELREQPLSIPEHFLVGEAQEREPRRLELGRLEEIPAELKRRAVIAAVNLDRQAHLGEIEVDDPSAAADPLAAKPPRERAATHFVQDFRERTLGAGRTPAPLPRNERERRRVAQGVRTAEPAERRKHCCSNIRTGQTKPICRFDLGSGGAISCRIASNTTLNCSS